MMGDVIRIVSLDEKSPESRVQSPVSSYRDLRVWQQARVLVKKVYQATENFPSKEIYGLTNQIRRCAVSVPSNIAEGSSRRSTAEFIRFINIACGSLAELETQLIVASDLEFLEEITFHKLMEDCAVLGKGLYALHNSLNSKASTNRRSNKLDSGLWTLDSTYKE